MRFLTVLYLLGWALLGLAGAMVVPFFVALKHDGLGVAQTFAVPLFALAMVSGLLIIAFRGQPQTQMRRQNLLLLFCVLLIAPLAAAMPLYLSGFPGDFLHAYFESVSAFTTTGATIFDDLSILPRSILVWRSLLQWLGGLTTLLALLALLGSLSGTDLLDRQLRLIGRPMQDSISNLYDVLESVAPLYVLLTSVCFLLLVLTGLPAFDSLCLALSTLATGGFMPRNGPLDAYVSPLGQIVLAVFLFAGAVSFVWVRAIFQARWPVVRETREPFWILWLMLGGAAILTIALSFVEPAYGLHGAFRLFASGLLTSASLFSTSAFIVTDPGIFALPMVVLIVICVMGGGRFSTAGGLKVFRVFLMLRQIGRELRLLIYPHGVRAARFGDEARERELLKATWITFAAFMLALALVVGTVAYSGVPFTGALLAGSGALSNMGSVYALAGTGETSNLPPYSGMPPLAHVAMCLGMIVGRVEVIAFLALVNISYWRH
ncbi:MAG: TrkH family potassium uptake protein [Hyphomicrobiales bacterium]